MKRIGFIAPAPWSTVSGGYVYDRAIVAGLREAGAQVDVIELEGDHPLPDAVAVAAARTAWRAVPPDAVPVIDGLGLPCFASMLDELVARGAVALVHHPTALETGRDDAIREQLREIERTILPKLRRIVVTSPDTERRLVQDFGVDPGRIAVVVPGTPDAPRSGGPSDETGCAILSIGTLLPRKGHDVLLRALARLPDLDWSLTIVGGTRDHAYAEELRALPATLGLSDRVRFAGEIAGDALEPLWQSAAIFALATYYEGYGMVVAEALRRGIPVAVTAGGAVADLVSPEVGVVAEPGDAVALSNALRRLVFDVALRRSIADAAWALGRTLPDWTQQTMRFSAALQS